LKAVLQTIWEELPKEHINKAVANFTKRFTVYVAVAADDGHFEHAVTLSISKSASSSQHQKTRLCAEPPADYW